MSLSPPRRLTLRIGLVVLVAMVFALPVAPSVTAQNPVYGVDDRVFPEPMEATSFLQWPDFIAGIETLESEHAQYMDVRIIGESLEGRPIYFIELTNEESEKSREEKLQIGYSASIHANEAAGREGMVRVIEDLVSGTGELGDKRSALDDVIVNIWFPNPDSWASGDWFTVDPERIFEGPPGYYRENAAGLDLNRQFPNPGTKMERHTPMSEPESRSVVQELRYSGRHDNLVAGTDLHGMINSPNMMRAIIPNQDMDFHRMMHAIRFLNDLEDRVDNNAHFAEWKVLAEALCMVPVEEPDVPEPPEEGSGAHGHEHADEDPLADLSPEARAQLDLIDDGDGVWTMEEAQAAEGILCGNIVDGATGGVGHDKPFLWGARWDQIGYTDSGFTSDYLMLSPRSPTGGMGAVGTITEFAYSHMVPNNHYVPKLNDMHVAGVRETVATQIEYTLLLEQPRLTGTGPVLYVENPERVTSETDPNPYESENGKPFNLEDESTWFDFNQVQHDVANTDFWADLAAFSDDAVDNAVGEDVTLELLAGYDHLVITDETIGSVNASLVRDWVEGGGNLIVTDAALGFFDDAGLTSGAAFMETHYLGHSDLVEEEHPLLRDVVWNARQTGEAIPIGYEMNEYPQWHLDADKAGGLDLDLAGTTGGDPSLGTVKLGDGQVHFIGGALPQPTQQNDHRYGLAPYALTALSYYVFVNALGGDVDWQPRDEPFVPEYPADPLYGTQTHEEEPEPDTEESGGPGLAFAFVMFALLGAAGVALRRRGGV